MQAAAVWMNVLEFAEPVLIALCLIFLVKSGKSKRFPAMMAYLSLRTASSIVLEIILNLHRFTHISETLQYSIYFYTYWPFYTLSAIAIFFVIREIFCHVTEPVPGIRRFGLLAFNWVAVISGIISISSSLPLKGLGAGLMSIGFQVMRCVSILELCLLAFLALFIHSLGRSFRSLAFGVALGFGVQAAIELIVSIVASRSTALDVNLNIVLQVVITRGLIRMVILLRAARACCGARGDHPARFLSADPLERDRERPRSQHTACCCGSVGSLIPEGCRAGCR